MMRDIFIEYLSFLIIKYLRKKRNCIMQMNMIIDRKKKRKKKKKTQIIAIEFTLTRRRRRSKNNTFINNNNTPAETSMCVYTKQEKDRIKRARETYHTGDCCCLFLLFSEAKFFSKGRKQGLTNNISLLLSFVD